jgi:hypothetical protein
MRTIISILLMLIALCAVACDPPAAQPPVAPQQEVVVQEYGDDQAQADEAMEELTSLHNTVQDSLKQWRDTPAPVGPVFEGEEDALAQEILQNCDTLEREASALSEQTYIREHQGAALDLKDMIRFAQETREEVRNGTQVP